MGDQVWPGSFPPDNHSSDFQVALLLKGMSREWQCMVLSETRGLWLCPIVREGIRLN